MNRRRTRYPYRPVRDALWRGFWWLVRAALAVAVAVAVAPVTLVGCLAFWYAWWRGWPPRRVYAAAVCCLPMMIVWLSAIAVWPDGSRSVAGRPGAPAGVGAGAWWLRVAAAPYRAWVAMWPLLAHGHPVAAAVAVAAPAVPLGIAAGGACWAYRRFRMRTGAGGLTPESPAAFDARQWRHQVRTAQALIAAPGSLPLLSRSGHVVVGAAIRSVRHRAGRAAAIPYERLRAHQVVIGSTGTGKTTLLLRLWAGFMAGGLRRYAAGTGRRPLLVVLDCKGGASSRKVADRTRRVLRDAGARSTAIWPDEATLSLWALPPDRLVTTLLDLIEHGTGGAAYYTDVMEALVELAVYAPCGPPVSSADFLTRLDADWLAAGYALTGDREAVSVIRSGKRALEDVRLRFRALWRRLGAGLDGGGSLADADAWYCVLEGTAEVAVAEAQARALTDLLAFHALRGDREILLCVDEFSAVARRLPIWRLYERARSLGLAVQVSAQSWEGLAGSDDERWRVAATAEGGIWLLRTPRPSPVAELAGNRPSVDTSRRMAGAGPWDDEGLSRAGTAPVLDGDLVRRLEVGQVCYVYRNGATFLQIKRLTGRQAAIGRGSAVAWSAGADSAAGGAAGAAAPGGLGGLGGEPPTEPFGAVAGSAPRAVPVAGGRGWPGVPVPGPALPDASEVLDEAFGERRG
ncbi:MAG TPA: hypothetical protein VMI73_23700 [Trebonia sp.]|nr:hypothetical protein [Trebonia sp.]